MEKITENEIKEFYTKNFDAKRYQEVINQEFVDVEHFFMSSLAKIFAKPEIEGSNLLELASGPVIPHIAFASKRFSNIVLSDFLQCNRDALKKWLNKDKHALDWEERHTLCAKLQGYKDTNVGRLEMESLIRANVKAVTECDFLADQIVPALYNVPYEAVLSCRALEVACPNYAAYKNSLKKIATLVRPNGYLILIGYFKSTFYVVGDNRFPVLSLTHKEVQQALEGAGFQDIEWRFFFNKKEQAPDDPYDYETAFCLYCKKSVGKK